MVAVNTVAVHDMDVHATSTISAEGVLLFRSGASLANMENVKDFTGLDG